METECSSASLGLTEKRARWLVTWLREKSRAGNVTAKEMAQGLGRLGFAAICLDWERPFLGPLYAWSSAIQGRQGPMTIPTMLQIGWRGTIGCNGRRGLSFFTDAKAEDGGRLPGDSPRMPKTVVLPGSR